MVRVLTGDDVADLLSLDDLLGVVEDAFVRQGRGEVERPARPHFPVGTDLDPNRPGESLGTGLTMPAYVHGADHYATKLVGVHPDNAERGLPTIHAQIVLTEADTGRPATFVDGTHVTGARTGCIGGLAARELAPEGPVRLGVLGAGTQARWGTRAIATATDLESVRVYSPSDSKHEFAADLGSELGAQVEATGAPEDAVADASVVLTATTAKEPVFPGEALAPGTLVVAVGAYTADMQEVDEETFDRAARVFADVPEEVAGIGDAIAAGLDADDLVPLSDVFEGLVERETADEILVVESVGTAVLDAAAAEYVYGEAMDADVGVDVTL